MECAQKVRNSRKNSLPLETQTKELPGPGVEEADIPLEQPSSDELLMELPVRGVELKKKLEEAFGDITEEALEKATTMYGKENSVCDSFEKVLMLVGNACGYCFAQGLELPEEHEGQRDALQ